MCTGQNCNIKLDKGGQAVNDECKSWYKFAMKSAMKEKVTGVYSTNVPIKCVVCTNVEVFKWKYGLAQHYKDVHANLEPPEHQQSFEIKEEEKKRLINSLN